jgi:hypothetical protein
LGAKGRRCGISLGCGFRADRPRNRPSLSAVGTRTVSGLLEQSFDPPCRALENLLPLSRGERRNERRTLDSDREGLQPSPAIKSEEISGYGSRKVGQALRVAAAARTRRLESFMDLHIDCAIAFDACHARAYPSISISFR